MMMIKKQMKNVRMHVKGEDENKDEDGDEDEDDNDDKTKEPSNSLSHPPTLEGDYPRFGPHTKLG